MQAVRLSARKVSSTDGIASFLQLPHFSEAVAEKLARKVCWTFTYRVTSVPGFIGNLQQWVSWDASGHFGGFTFENEFTRES